MAVAAVRLPVLGMVGRAFEDVWASLGGVARMAWPWYAAALAPTLAGEVGASYGAGSALWGVAGGAAGARSGMWRRGSPAVRRSWPVRRAGSATSSWVNRCAGRRGSTATSAAT